MKKLTIVLKMSALIIIEIHFKIVYRVFCG